MKKLILFSALAAKLWLASLAQPVMTNGVVARLDFDGDESQDLDYIAFSDHLRSEPEDWFSGNALEPYRFSRIVMATNQRLSFVEGEAIDANRPVYKKKLSSGESYNLLVLDYRALSFDGGQTWQYTTITSALEKESNLLLGLKLVVDTGTHYGWIRLSRPVVDLHTPFELADYAYHPVPDQPIGAGEPPPPPPLGVTVLDDGQLQFNWDSAWGAVLLEWTDNLAQPNWQPLPSGGWTDTPPEAGPRFYRLRRP